MNINEKHWKCDTVDEGLNHKFDIVRRLRCSLTKSSKYELIMIIWHDNNIEYALLRWRSLWDKIEKDEKVHGLNHKYSIL